MHVFVTGATGLIGRRLCAELLRRGDEVTALTRSWEAARRLPAGARENLGQVRSAPGPSPFGNLSSASLART